MDVVGVVAEARNVAQSIIRRIENYRHGRKAVKVLRESLAHLTEKIEEVGRLVQTFPGALPDEVYPLFNTTLESVRRSLQDLHETVHTNFSKAFATRSSSFVEHLTSKGYRVFRASALISKVNSVEAQIRDASNDLLHLIVLLAIALKVDKRTISDSAPEQYRPGISAPAVSHTVHLDFQTKNKQGHFVTPEGVLKQEVLCSASSATVTAAAGALNPVYGAVGMAGVAKRSRSRVWRVTKMFADVP